jgi:hypothetical protein
MYTKIKFVNICGNLEVWRLFYNSLSHKKIWKYPTFLYHSNIGYRYKPVVSMNNDPPVVSY